ncbi:MAG: glycoside hydrolase family 13 protein [Cyclobacteriaceae bacterium]
MLKSSYTRLFAVILLSTFFSSQSLSQTIDRVEPPNWWVGMNQSTVQLLIKGDDLQGSTVKLSGNKNVDILKVHEAQNPNFLFVDLEIRKNATAHTFQIELKKPGSKRVSLSYELKSRNTESIVPVDQSDAIYLITPDRFVNGNIANDSIGGMMEGANRDFHGGRHGGDLVGVISKLDYLESLGVTTLWLNPVVENNMPEYSYHGYAITDFYNVDPRYGSNELYKSLSDKLHAKNMKLVMDMVFNHCGLEHWWMKDSPFEDWVHDADDFKITNHSISSQSDPYATESDLNEMERGWFVPTMPDLNHSNTFMATYLIQNSIWWVEYAGLDGIRMDTYPYNDKNVMQQWTNRMLSEYPNLFLLGETWVSDESTESYWAPKKQGSEGYNTGLTSTTDFPLCYAVHKAFGEDGDVKNLFETLGKDFLYDMPEMNTTFLDNHDMDRFFYTIGKNLDRFKLATTFLITTRGIPQIYYGTEILMENFNHHGHIRQDFPGGWSSDDVDAFDYENLSEDQKTAFLHIQNLLNFRKSSEVIQKGSLKHYLPENNVYVYSREHEGKRVMVLLNNSTDASTVSLERFQEAMNGFTLGTDVITGTEFKLQNDLTLAPLTGLILELSELNN